MTTNEEDGIVYEGTAGVLDEVWDERERQDEKWGEQNHLDGTGWATYVENALAAKARCDNAAKLGCVSWKDILDEEVCEVFAERDEAMLRKELVQVAAVAVAWIECIDRRTK